MKCAWCETEMENPYIEDEDGGRYCSYQCLDTADEEAHIEGDQWDRT